MKKRRREIVSLGGGEVREGMLRRSFVPQSINLTVLFNFYNSQFGIVVICSLPPSPPHSSKSKLGNEETDR